MLRPSEQSQASLSMHVATFGVRGIVSGIESADTRIGRMNRLATMLFLIALALPVGAQVPIVVNVQSNRHAISDLIYGVAFADSNQLKELNAPLNRSGGNADTR